jgi:hypothetical protein
LHSRQKFHSAFARSHIDSPLSIGDKLKIVNHGTEKVPGIGLASGVLE